MYLKQKDETTEFKGKILSLKALRALRLSASFCTYACGGWLGGCDCPFALGHLLLNASHYALNFVTRLSLSGEWGGGLGEEEETWREAEGFRNERAG